MRILVVSLLRLGDFLMQAPLLRELRGEGEVHVLVNDSVAGLAPLFPEFTFHVFPREALQRSLVSRDCPLLGAVRLLDETLRKLDSAGFDRIENWTHTFLSARIMGLLESRAKLGAVRDRKTSLEGPRGVAYLNETWSAASNPTFHWIDALAYAMNRKPAPLPRMDRHRPGPVLLQALTSDEKKNWGLGNWKLLARGLVAHGIDTRVLCAPFERDRLIAEGWAEVVEIQAPSLSELPAVLGGASLLVSGDTSAVHMAALAGTPVLGLYLGPANPMKTGPRLEGARVLWSDPGCAPCSHRGACGRETHVCSENLRPERVLQEVLRMRSHEPDSFGQGNVRRFEVVRGPGGAFALAEAGREDLFGSWARIVWDFYLNGDHEERIPPFASAARLWMRQAPDIRWEDWTRSMGERLARTEAALESVTSLVARGMAEFAGGAVSAETSACLRNESERLAFLWKGTDFALRLQQATLPADEPDFARIRRWKEALRETVEINTIQRNLLRVIEQEMKERGGAYGARA